MHLRKLELRDAPLMLEWMHDADVTKYLRANFSSKTIEDARVFIQTSWIEKSDIHRAVSSDYDEYMGTVSLRNIMDGQAEFAIALRSQAIGKGYGWYSMKGVLEMAFLDLSLEQVYWCVDPRNLRALGFYNKHCFKRCDPTKLCVYRYQIDEAEKLEWFLITSREFDDRRFCKQGVNK